MIVNNANPNKLADELVESNIEFIMKNDKKDNEYIAPNTWITFPEGTDMSAVQAIIDAHDPTPVIIPDPDEELAEAIQTAIQDEPVGSPVRKLAEALLGSGRPARVKGKRKS